MPTVSVIIPTYNRSGYLAQALRSVVNQSFQDWEAIVVDDGSTDSTADMVSSFDDTRIRYLHQPNTGRSRARNLGITQAYGRYIAFLDDDDLYMPDKLAIETEYLDMHPRIGLVSGGAIVINESGQHIRQQAGWLFTPNLDVMSCVKGCPLFPTIVMIRQEALKHLDGLFDESLDLAEDTDLFIRLALSGCEMAWQKRYIACYRLHQSGSQSDALRYQRTLLYVMDKVSSHPKLPDFVRNQMPDVYISIHLATACRCYALSDVETGKAEYAHALAMDPSLAEGSPPRALHVVASFADSLIVNDPNLFLRTFWRHLPPEVHYSSTQRAQTRSLIHMRHVFAAHAYQVNGQASLRDWLWGVANDPRWLWNRGVWSILLQILGLKKTRAE